MPLKSRRSPGEGEFLFEIDEQPTEECLTALGGIPLLVRTARSLDVPGSVKRNLALKQRDRGFDEATYVESFLVLNAAGGDCLDDFHCLREDRGLAAILGPEEPSPEAARKFLYQFYDPEKIEQAYREDSVAVKECARVEYFPEETAANRYREPLRTIAIRIRKKQQSLFADGSQVKYFAVRTNLWGWKPQRVLDWHREKAGTIEAVHDVLKNELAAGVLPCGRHGANAAWLRLAVITYNVMTAMKRLVLPPDLQTARPKRLRFLIFQQPGKLIHHARKTVLRLARTWNRFSNWKHAMEMLALPARV
jgi:hypothetical protein